MALLKHGRALDNDAPILPTLEELLASNIGTRVSLPPDADLDALAPRLSALKSIEVEFPKYADGRGFSIARQLRKTFG